MVYLGSLHSIVACQFPERVLIHGFIGVASYPTCASASIGYSEDSDGPVLRRKTQLRENVSVKP